MKTYLKALFNWILIVAAPAAVFIGLLIALSWKIRPDWDIRGTDILEMVINLHFQRTQQFSNPDILILGDSSSLTGVNARKLHQKLNPLSVQSLATFRNHTPAGHGMMLTHLMASEKKPKYIVYQVHPETAKADPQIAEHLLNFTQTVRSKVTNGSYFRDPRERLIDVFGLALQEPLQGIYGARYGKPNQYAEELNQDHGTIVDPYPFGWETEACGQQTPPYTVTDQYKENLKIFADQLSKTDTKVGILISAVPCILATPDYVTYRENFKTFLIQTFKNSNAVFLDTPISYPNNMFATETHLNEKGREKFTAELIPIIENWIKTVQ